MKTIRSILPFVGPYWKFSVLSLALLTAVVMMDLTIPRLVQRIIDEGISQNSQAVVLQTAALMLGISLLSAVLAIGNNYFSVRVGEAVARDLREAIFKKIQSFSFDNLDVFPTGNLMVRLTSDASAVQRLVQITLRIGTRAPMLMVGSLILMIRTSPSLAFSIFPLLLITSLVVLFFSLRMEPLYRSVQEKLDRLNTVLQENIAGARLVKAFVRARFESERFESANEDYTSQSIRAMQFFTAMAPVLTIFVNIGMVIVIWSGGLQAIRGNMTIGQIVAFTNYLLTTMTPLIMMTLLSNVWASGIASSQRINEVLETVPSVQDDPDSQALPVGSPTRVEFRDVGFQYNGAWESKVLEDINLTAQRGQTIAILGATGAGKSSLINLIPRFYDVSSGKVAIDDYDIRCLEQDALLTNVSIVPQETFLFAGTVRDNIRYGHPTASDSEVISAAKAAQAHDFIIRLPEGYDSPVEPRGANFSGGQKQRLAIARALATKPAILLLDDSTSSVDVETETRIQNAIQEKMGSTIRFVVAQRISTVLNADKILVLDKGRLVAQGTHKELMQTSSVYREIYDSQLGDGFSSEANNSDH
jgi:ATP-binding cassette, subfamily B, multidrug efflux pump